MTNKVTKVDSDIFKEMITDQGTTIHELCQKGAKVLLYFLNSLGCQFCQGRIDDLYNLYDSLIKLNVVPVILYNEETEDYKNWVENNTKYDSFDIFYSMKQGKFTKIFEIQPINRLLYIGNLHFIREKLRLNKLGFLVNKILKKKVPSQLATAFVIYQDQIISEYRPATPDERFDFTKIIIDPENFGISVSSSILECTFIPKRKRKRIIKKIEEIEKIEIDKEETKKEEIQTEKTLEKKNSFFSFFSKSSKNEEKKEITLQDVLSNDLYRKYFKVHITKEFAVENLVFWEEVQIYKEIKDENVRKERIVKMIDIFFQENSIYEVNTSKKRIKEITDNKDKADINIFQEVENDVYESCFIDAFIRFSATEEFVEMTTPKKKPKTSYLL